MNAKQVKKLRQIQRRQLLDIPEEVKAAIEKAFLMGVEAGYNKAKEESQCHSASPTNDAPTQSTENDA